MPNRRRGEIAAVLDGRERVLCLTLGALAELEDALGAGDIVALAGRFEAGRLSARDMIRVIGAGLRGAGETVSDDEVAAMRAEGGAAGFARIVAELLQATFGGSDGGDPDSSASSSSSSSSSSLFPSSSASSSASAAAHPSIPVGMRSAGALPSGEVDRPQNPSMP